MLRFSLSFIPSVWLPTYTVDIGLEKPTGSVLISIMNGNYLSCLPTFFHCALFSTLVLIYIIFPLASHSSSLSLLSFLNPRSPSHGLPLRPYPPPLRHHPLLPRLRPELPLPVGFRLRFRSSPHRLCHRLWSAGSFFCCGLDLAYQCHLK